MFGVPTADVGFPASGGRISSRNRWDELHLVKFYYDLPAHLLAPQMTCNKGKKKFSAVLCGG